jgi:hypothetical protein
MQGFPGQDFGFYSTKIQVAFEYVSVADVYHKLVDSMSSMIGFVDQGSYTSATQAFQPVASYFTPTFLPGIYVTTLDHHLRTVYFAHS